MHSTSTEQQGTAQQYCPVYKARTCPRAEGVVLPQPGSHHRVLMFKARPMAATASSTTCACLSVRLIVSSGSSGPDACSSELNRLAWPPPPSDDSPHHPPASSSRRKASFCQRGGGREKQMQRALHGWLSVSEAKARRVAPGPRNSVSNGERGGPLPATPRTYLNLCAQSVASFSAHACRPPPRVGVLVVMAATLPCGVMIVACSPPERINNAACALNHERSPRARLARTWRGR